MPAPMPSLLLLRARGQVHIRGHLRADGGRVQRPVRCECASALEGDWLIVVDGTRVMFICRCGRRQSMDAVRLEDVAAMVEAEPLRPHWRSLEDGLDELGFNSSVPTSRSRDCVTRRTRRPRRSRGA